MAHARLAIGAYGADVADLQRALLHLGFQLPDSEISRSFFGPATRQAVLQLQEARGIQPSGAVDDTTASAIASAGRPESPLGNKIVMANGPIASSSTGSRESGASSNNDGAASNRADGGLANAQATPVAVTANTTNALPLSAPSTSPSITPNSVSGAVAGVSITVTGSATGGSQPGSGDPYNLDSPMVEAGGASPVPASWTSGGWSATVRFPSPGSAFLTARLNYTDNRGRKGPGSPAIQSVPVTVGEQPVTLTPVPSPPLTSNYLTYPLQVDASSPIGVALVVYSLDAGKTWVPLTPHAGAPWSASVALPVTNPVDPKNGAPVSLGVGGFDQAQAPPARGTIPPPPVQQTWTVTAVDTTAPTVHWLEPPDGTALELLGNATTAQTTVLAVICDEDNGAVSGGIGATDVTCTVDGTSTFQLVQLTGTDTWSVDVTQLPEGPHTLQLDVKDNAGNLSPQQKRTVVVRRSGIQGTTEQDYLADLVDFVYNRLLTRQCASAGVTAWHLERAFRQPFRRLAGAGSVRVKDPAVAPVNAVRAAIEVLRAYLMPASAAPVAHWPLDEGTGTLVRDDTGGGSTGTLAPSQSVVWGMGPPGASAAPMFDGASSRMSVESTAQLAVASSVSIAAWILPTPVGTAGASIHPTVVGTAGSVITALDQWCALALGADRVLRILSNASGNAVLVDTGVAVPLSQWSHVAICYDGTAVQTYLNGTHASTTNVSGVTGLTPAQGPGGCQVGCTGAPPGRLFFSGSIADVGVYDVVLTAQDVSLLAGTAPSAGQFAGALHSSGYLPAAYEAILGAIGTSSEELRTATRATPEARAALAARLGLALVPGRPDQLDQLLLMPSGTGASALNEANLQTLFGLQPTDADPLTPSPGTPLLQQWQQAALRAGWAAQDYASAKPADYSPPIVDPDIVFDGDVANRTDQMGQCALTLRTTRLGWLGHQITNLTRPAAGTGLPALVTSTLGIDLIGTDPSSLACQSAQGYDISGQLASVPIAADALDRLVTLAGLPDALRDDEWDDASAIIVQVLKTRQFTTWRTDEQKAGLLLDPSIFTAVAVTPDQLPRWRASWSARVQWQERLAGRNDQITGIEDALTAAVATAEQIALPMLRDAALQLALPPLANPPVLATAADQLGLSLCTDLQAGPQLQGDPARARAAITHVPGTGHRPRGRHRP